MVLFIQPWDKPWTSPRIVSKRKSMYLSRSQFEVGWQVPSEFGLRFLDLNLSLKEGTDIKQAIITELEISTPKLVLISWPAYVLGDQVRLIIDTVASECPEACIVVGGAAISLVKERVLRDWPNVEACYAGNGFEIPELVQSFIQSGTIANIPGVYSRNGNSCCPAIEGNPALIDGYSVEGFYTARGRINFSNYIARYRSAGINLIGILEMTRGCRFRCDFCAINFNRIGFQQRSVETVIEEARFLAKHGILRQHLIDPTLGLNSKATVELLSGLAEVAQEFPEFSLEVLTRPELIKDEFVKLLRQAGVCRCAIGMETMDQPELSQVSKTLKPWLTSSAIKKLSESGIETKLFHILFPGKLSFATIKFFSKLKQRGVEFMVQSSFLRSLANPENQTDYLNHDQTVFVPSRDSIPQLMEWMLVNLAFPSMDMGFKCYDDLQRMIEKASSVGDLENCFEITQNGKRVSLYGENNRYSYVHPKIPEAVANCLRIQ